MNSADRPGRVRADAIDVDAVARLAEVLAHGDTPAGELVELFLADSRAGIETLREALGRGDAPAVARRLHQLRGDAGVFGARLLHDLCRSLEPGAGAARLDRVAELLPEVEAALEATGALLREELSGPPGT